MSTTLTTARTRLRSMLREPIANQWSDARLNDLLQDADWEVHKKIAKVRNAGYGEVQEALTLPANASTVSLTPGTPPTALTYNLKGILFIEHQGTSGFWNLCNELQEADEFRYRDANSVTATGDTPPLYRLRRPNLICLPVATVDRTLKVTYRPLPTSFSAGSTTLDVDDDYVPLVCTRAAIFAMADVGEQETQWDSAYGVLEDEMYADLAHATAEGRSLQVKAVEGPALFAF